MMLICSNLPILWIAFDFTWMSKLIHSYPVIQGVVFGDCGNHWVEIAVGINNNPRIPGNQWFSALN